MAAADFNIFLHCTVHKIYTFFNVRLRFLQNIEKYYVFWTLNRWISLPHCKRLILAHQPKYWPKLFSLQVPFFIIYNPCFYQQLRMVEPVFKQQKCSRALETVSHIDGLPFLNWPMLFRWKNRFNDLLRQTLKHIFVECSLIVHP